MASAPETSGKIWIFSAGVHLELMFVVRLRLRFQVYGPAYAIFLDFKGSKAGVGRRAAPR